MAQEETTLGEIKTILTNFLGRVDKNEKKVTEMEKQVDENKNGLTEAKENMLQNELIKLKNISRAKNLILYGLADTNEINNNLGYIIKEIVESVNLNMNQVESYSRIGKIEGNRPVIIALNSQNLKVQFFNNIDVLKERGYNIANDTTKEERETYKKLKEIKNELLSLGIESKIKRTKIMINNEYLEQEEACKYLEKKRKEKHNNNNNNIIEEKDNGYTSDASSIISNHSQASKKRERQESKSPEGSNDKKIYRGNKKNNFARPKNYITQYYEKKTSRNN